MFVEFIGIPGSGKSTLIKNLKKDTVPFKFKTWEEIEPKAVQIFMVNENLKIRKRFNSIWNIFWKTPKLNSYFSKFILQRNLKFSPSLHKGHWGEFAKLVIESVMKDTYHSTETKPYYINWELEKIIKAQLTRYYCNTSEDIVFLDEGMISAANTMKFNTDMFKKNLLPDAVIFLNIKPEIALKGIIERQKKRSINSIKKFKTDDEMLNLLEIKYQRYIMQINFLKKIGIPVIEYNRYEIPIDKLIAEIEIKLISRV